MLLYNNTARAELTKTQYQLIDQPDKIQFPYIVLYFMLLYLPNKSQNNIGKPA